MTSDPIGAGQSSQGISLVAFISALAVSLIIFGVQILAFLLLKNKLARILYVVESADPMNCANFLQQTKNLPRA